MEAFEALELSGNAAGLYTEAQRNASASGRLGWPDLPGQAAERRAQLSRRAILFAAFAAESFANEFLSMFFVGRTATTLDRLSTVEKLVIGPKLALGCDLFDRGTQPLQDIRTLFGLRDILVHPKPGRGLPSIDPEVPDPSFSPFVAAKSLVAAALTAEELLRHAPIGDRWDLTVTGIAGNRTEIVAFGREASEQLAQPDDAWRYLFLRLDQSRLPDFSELDADQRSGSAVEDD
jgi:hypothetical protein